MFRVIFIYEVLIFIMVISVRWREGFLFGVLSFYWEVGIGRGRRWWEGIFIMKF